MASTQGFEPGPHWWEASALTTAPPLRLENSRWVSLPIQRNLFGSTYVWFHLFTIIILNDFYYFFLNLFLEFSLWSRKRSERYLKIFTSLLSTVSKPPHAGTIFLNVTNKTLTFKSTLRRSDNPGRKSKEKKISIKGKTTRRLLSQLT